MILKLTRRHVEWGILCHIDSDVMFTHARHHPVHRVPSALCPFTSVDHQQWPSERPASWYLQQHWWSCLKRRNWSLQEKYHLWRRRPEAKLSEASLQTIKPHGHNTKQERANPSSVICVPFVISRIRLESGSPVPQQHGVISKKRCWRSIASAHSPVNTFNPIKGPLSYSSMLPTDWEARSVRTFLKSPARAEIRVGLFECSHKTRYDHYSIILLTKQYTVYSFY